MRLAEKNSGPSPTDQPLSAPLKAVARVARSSDEDMGSPARRLQIFLEGQVARDPFSGPSAGALQRAGVLAIGILAATIFCSAFWLVVFHSVSALLRLS